jgi:DNA polymerase-3 subunit gamma/tau
VRRVWDTVLTTVQASKRVTHARLLGTTVAGLDGTRLQVAFTTPTLARQFGEGVHIDVLREALKEVLGADLTVVCVAAPGAGGAPAGRAAPAGRPAATTRTPAPPEPEGFAAGDEPADDDEPALPRESGEEAALRLVQQALGGRVVGTIGE